MWGRVLRFQGNTMHVVSSTTESILDIIAIYMHQGPWPGSVSCLEGMGVIKEGGSCWWAIRSRRHQVWFICFHAVNFLLPRKVIKIPLRDSVNSIAFLISWTNTCDWFFLSFPLLHHKLSYLLSSVCKASGVSQGRVLGSYNYNLSFLPLKFFLFTSFFPGSWRLWWLPHYVFQHVISKQ